QCGLDGVLVWLFRMFGHNQQPLRRIADFHAARAVPSAAIEVGAELAADAKVALDLSQPAGQTARIGECRPQVLHIAVDAVLHTADARAGGRSQAAEDPPAAMCVAGHLLLLRSRFHTRRFLGVTLTTRYAEGANDDLPAACASC